MLYLSPTKLAAKRRFRHSPVMASNQVPKLRPQFLSRSKKAILGRFLAGAAHFTDQSQFQTFVVPQLKDHPLARRQLSECPGKPRRDLLGAQSPVRIKRGAIIGKRMKILRLTVFRRWRLNLAPGLLAAQLIQAYIGRNPIKPGGKARLEPEVIQRPVDL